MSQFVGNNLIVIAKYKAKLIFFIKPQIDRVADGDQRGVGVGARRDGNLHDAVRRQVQAEEDGHRRPLLEEARDAGMRLFRHGISLAASAACFMPVRIAAAARRLVSRGIVSYNNIKQNRKTGAFRLAPQWRRGTSAKSVRIPPSRRCGGARRDGR